MLLYSYHNPQIIISFMIFLGIDITIIIWTWRRTVRLTPFQRRTSWKRSGYGRWRRRSRGCRWRWAKRAVTLLPIQKWVIIVGMWRKDNQWLFTTTLRRNTHRRVQSTPTKSLPSTRLSSKTSITSHSQSSKTAAQSAISPQFPTSTTFSTAGFNKKNNHRSHNTNSGQRHRAAYWAISISCWRGPRMPRKCRSRLFRSFWILRRRRTVRCSAKLRRFSLRGTRRWRGKMRENQNYRSIGRWLKSWTQFPRVTHPARLRHINDTKDLSHLIYPNLHGRNSDIRSQNWATSPTRANSLNPKFVILRFRPATTQFKDTRPSSKNPTSN